MLAQALNDDLVGVRHALGGIGAVGEARSMSGSNERGAVAMVGAIATPDRGQMELEHHPSAGRIDHGGAR